MLNHSFTALLLLGYLNSSFFASAITTPRFNGEDDLLKKAGHETNSAYNVTTLYQHLQNRSEDQSIHIAKASITARQTPRPEIEFEKDLNVDPTKPWAADRYRNLIRDLRSQLQNPGSVSGGIPVLPPQDPTPRRWFGLTLRADSTTMIRLRLRSDNLYLDGFAYQGENDVEETWLEFRNNGNIHYIPGSTFLEFDGSYTALERRAQRSRYTVGSVGGVPLGQHELGQAIRGLANPLSTQEVRAYSLLVVIQMICEATRFTLISDQIADNYSNGWSPSEREAGLENGWRTLSSAMLHHDANPTREFLNESERIAMQLLSLDAATKVLGLLLWVSVRSSKPRRQAKPRIPEGRHLLEVLYMSFQPLEHLDHQDPREFYGSLHATGAMGRQLFYDRSQGDGFNLPYDALVPGPARAMSAEDSFTIDLNIWLKENGPFLLPENHNQISFNVYDPSNTYDKPRYTDLTTKDGQATVGWVPMSNAAEAMVEIIMRRVTDGPPLLGYIDVSTQFHSYRLWDDSNGPLFPHTGAAIPLSKSTFAVPIDSKLSFICGLTTYDGSPIAAGGADFEPEISKSVAMSIVGELGQIDIRVSWF